MRILQLDGRLQQVGNRGSAGAGGFSHAKIWVSFRCQNDCVFCGATHWRRKRQPFLSTGQIVRNLQEASSRGLKAVTFLGGEPTLHPELPEVIGHARSLGFEMIHVVSNGRRFSSREVLDRLIERGLTNLDLSIHAHEEQLGDSLSRSRGSFREQMQGARAAAEAASRNPLIVRAATVIQLANQHVLPDVVRRIHHEGIRSYSMYLCLPNDGSRQTLPKLAQLRQQLEDLIAALPSDSSVHIVGVPTCLVPERARECNLFETKELSAPAIRRASLYAKKLVKHALIPQACTQCAGLSQCAVPGPLSRRFYGKDWMTPLG
jgi:molybdenum cofactor biosynthesis enzyme MoaA